MAKFNCEDGIMLWCLSFLVGFALSLVFGVAFGLMLVSLFDL